MAEQTKELTPIKAAENWLGSYNDAFEKIATETDVPITFRREAGFALQILSTNNYTLKCALSDPDSLRHAILNVARTGLTLDPSRKLAYLLPRDGRVIFAPSYMGMIAQATDTGSIKSAHVDLVYSGDDWEYEERAEGPHLVHRRPRLSEPRGDLEGAYVRVVLPDGSTQVNVVSKDYLDRCMNTSDAVKKKRHSAYTDWADQMHLKSAIRFASKFWPKQLNAKLTPATAFHESGNPDHGGQFNEPEPENVTPISRAQADEILGQLEAAFNHDEDKMTDVLRRLLVAFEVADLVELPARRFDECKARIADMVAAMGDTPIDEIIHDEEPVDADAYDMPPASGDEGPS